MTLAGLILGGIRTVPGAAFVLGMTFRRRANRTIIKEGQRA
jgi:hypothetical protein